MPSFKSAGKSREDLAIVAQLAGLISAEESADLSRAELVKMIEKENRRTEQAERKKVKTQIIVPETPPATSAEPAKPKKAAKQAKATRSVPAAKAAEPAKPKGRARKKAAAMLEETDFPASPLTIAEPAAEPAAAAADQLARQPEPTLFSPTESQKQDEPLSEKSPEASEAATETQPPASSSETHRLPPHHTLTTTRPDRRRTVRDFSPTDASISAPAPRTGAKTARPGKFTRPSRPSGLPMMSGIPGNYEPDLSAENMSEPPAQPEDLTDTDRDAAAFQPGTSAALPLGDETESARTARPQVETGDLQAGVLEIMPDGYGFLRKENYLQGNKDIYVPPQYIRRFGLRPGDYVSGLVKLQRESDRYQALLYIKEVNEQPPEKMLRRHHFDRLTPIYPDDRFILETVRNELSTRIIDLVAPIGKGQRGMIVSPPKAGKTILLQKIANAISTNNPEVKLIVLLIDERPEEVTDMQRSINGEVVYSTFDKTPENHTKVTELVLERAMRLVELKHDVVILLDSMTRLARAYNLSINPTGRTLSGGLDPGALYGPKRFFGAARNIENGGSLTIIATSLIETGSRMDEVIFEEFKGTGNMEVYLDRKLSEKRIFPAIDINKSGTRREELLMNSKELDAVWTIRKAFSQLDTSSVTEAIINLLLKTKNNDHFISSINVSFNDKNVFDAMRGIKPQEQARVSPGAANGNGGYGYNTTGSASNYRRPTGYDED
jgi:transcription termination factor Rho